MYLDQFNITVSKPWKIWHFGSVFTTEDTNNIPASNSYYNAEKLITIEITTEMVKNKLLNLNDNKPP